MKKSLWLCLAGVGSALTLTSCSENDNTYNEYDNWQSRNTFYFEQVCDTARNAIQTAKATYGDQWTDHCNWRMMPSYTKEAGATGLLTDSICVKVIEKGTGKGCPFYTDTVKVNYRGYLIPTTDENGKQRIRVFDQSYYGAFNPATDVPTKFVVSGVVSGFGTALQYMHIGDVWDVYIPSDLGYGSSAANAIPAYSTIRFRMNLADYYRPE